MKPISEEWIRFEYATLPAQIDAGERRRLRLAFYAGAARIFDRFNKAKDGTDDQIIAFVDALETECAEVSDKIERGTL